MPNFATYLGMVISLARRSLRDAACCVSKASCVTTESCVTTAGPAYCLIRSGALLVQYAQDDFSLTNYSLLYEIYEADPCDASGK
jgi:hypothetical protein